VLGVLLAGAALLVATARATGLDDATSAPAVYFDWFEYSGHDAVFDEPAPAGTYRNPILAGFYPDPSVTWANGAFYLVNSTFTYFPGVPVLESRDLVHWRQVGQVIDRPGELNFDGLTVSRGIYAPSIAFHDGLFYVVTTAVNSGGTFLSTARNPAGPWSDPQWLPQVDGIDPSLFFDDDGRAYILNNGPPVGPPKYDGHRAIWIQEFDVATRKTVGRRKVLVNGGVNFSKKPVWIEGPHMYRRDGWYFLMCAEGGTSVRHSEVVLRARSPWGPFKPFAGNPILTQRDLPPDRPAAVINAGHADLVATPDGSWWAVFLGSRPYEKIHFNTGRETFLLPVTWTNDWPTILGKGVGIPPVAEAPGSVPGTAASADPTTGNFTWRDEFDSPALKPEWLQVRVPKRLWASLSERPGWLSLHARPVQLDSLGNPSFLGHRQQHQSFDASTELEVPEESAISAGLAAFQSENYWYFLGVRRQPGSTSPEVFLEKRAGSHTETIARAAIDAGSRLKLRISGNARAYSFYFDQGGSGWKALKEADDGSILSTDVAGGFVGTVIGPYATAESQTRPRPPTPQFP
jgi:alpha-N-arabinofuranosidase